MEMPSQLILALRRHTPNLLRWSGAVARRLRQFNIAIEGKSSGSANTDALTLADLSIQELLVAGLRDADPLFRECRIEAEESTGDLGAFAQDSPLVIALDPIDGTRQFRDRTGNGWGVMLHVRNERDVLYSLVFVPELGPQGTWVQAFGDTIRCGEDDPGRPAADLLEGMPALRAADRPDSKNVYLIGFQRHDAARAADVTAAALCGVPPDEMPTAIYPLLARGEFGGSLIHSPNVYDFPVSLHLARILGGDAVWVDSGRSVDFRETWLDERADMLRLPGIVACSPNRRTLEILTLLARDWNPVRYAD
jgi:3'(2'), 5'-bisphosphate nucleotidase